MSSNAQKMYALVNKDGLILQAYIRGTREAVWNAVRRDRAREQAYMESMGYRVRAVNVVICEGEPK